MEHASSQVPKFPSRERMRLCLVEVPSMPMYLCYQIWHYTSLSHLSVLSSYIWLLMGTCIMSFNCPCFGRLSLLYLTIWIRLLFFAVKCPVGSFLPFKLCLCCLPWLIFFLNAWLLIDMLQSNFRQRMSSHSFRRYILVMVYFLFT